MEEEEDEELPDELTCRLCNDLVQDPHKTQCCQTSYCRECIINRLLESDEQKCPNCKRDLTPMQLTEDKILKMESINFKNRNHYRFANILGSNNFAGCRVEVAHLFSMPTSTILWGLHRIFDVNGLEIRKMSLHSKTCHRDLRRCKEYFNATILTVNRIFNRSKKRRDLLPRPATTSQVARPKVTYGTGYGSVYNSSSGKTEANPTKSSYVVKTESPQVINVPDETKEVEIVKTEPIIKPEMPIPPPNIASIPPPQIPPIPIIPATQIRGLHHWLIFAICTCKKLKLFTLVNFAHIYRC